MVISFGGSFFHVCVIIGVDFVLGSYLGLGF